jgi:hypothetical protein
MRKLDMVYMHPNITRKGRQYWLETGYSIEFPTRTRQPRLNVSIFSPGYMARYYKVETLLPIIANN